MIPSTHYVHKPTQVRDVGLPYDSDMIPVDSPVVKAAADYLIAEISRVCWSPKKSSRQPASNVE